ncbi:MAG: CBS domain-containing protein [Bacteroidetes bacterium]|jgi:Zn-dependent protease|nr:CBS domain-containing protein [Bacteroidota bacterium]
MKRLKIGSAAGIGIYLHWTFWLLIVGIFAFYLYQGSTVTAAVIGVGLVLAIFVCVVLHELGHALTARRYDVPTRDITIYPIGGVARLQRIPEEPLKEFWIAVAGPAVNVVIAGILGALILATGDTLMPRAFIGSEEMTSGGSIWATLMWINVALVGFNLLPAFPMDGGRVLRALLATQMDYARATQLAANVGQGMAVLFGLLGLIIFNPILIFIAVFVFFGARQESQQAMMRSLTRGVPVRQAMLTRFAKLHPDDTLDDAIEELLAGSDQDFPVVEDGHIIGVLTRKQMMQALSEQGRDARIGDIVEEGNCAVVEDTTMLREAFERVQSAACNTLPVVRQGELVGLLTLENVGELMMISSALRQAGNQRAVRKVLDAHGNGSETPTGESADGGAARLPAS